MHCPRCGQQQLVDYTRFCSRCGLPLNTLSEWLASGGGLSLQTSESRATLDPPSREHVRPGAKLMFWSGVLLPVCLLIGGVIDNYVPILLPPALFFVGLILMLHAKLFGEQLLAGRALRKNKDELSSSQPESHLFPAADWLDPLERNRLRTGDLEQPGSVTDHTTKLLG